MHLRSILFAAGCGLALSPSLASAGNPLIPTVLSADPSAHVWPGDERLWVYASHDEPGTNTHDTMASYHVFSTTDLVNWTDYGSVLHLKNVSWAGSHMWAIDCVRWKGTYYLVFCAKEKGTGIFRTGLATSAVPQGPFTDIGYIQGVEWGQDPALFVDDDGAPYLFWGAGGSCSAARLSDDLRSVVPGSVVNLTSQLKDVFEGPWVHKHRGKYYLSYPGLPGGQWPEVMFYATADQPLGPYEFRGQYIPYFEGQAGTNHGSIVRYKDRWFAFHHSMWITGLSEARNLMCDELEYNEDGTIKPIIPTREGVAIAGTPRGSSRVVMQLEAENGPAALGELRDVDVATSRAGYSGAGYVTRFTNPGAAVIVTAQVAAPTSWRLFIRYRAPDGDRRNKLLVNATSYDDPASPNPQRFDKAIEFPKSEGWTVKDAGVVKLQSGNNTISLYVGPGATGGIDIDAFTLEPVAP
jgi:hypothetical protein